MQLLHTNTRQQNKRGTTSIKEEKGIEKGIINLEKQYHKHINT